MANVELPDVFVVVKPYLATIARRLTRYGRLNVEELLYAAMLRLWADRAAVLGADDPVSMAKRVGKRRLLTAVKREEFRQRAKFRTASAAAGEDGFDVFDVVTSRELEPIALIDEFDVPLRLARVEDRELLAAWFRDGLSLDRLAGPAG